MLKQRSFTLKYVAKIQLYRLVLMSDTLHISSLCKTIFFDIILVFKAIHNVLEIYISRYWGLINWQVWCLTINVYDMGNNGWLKHVTVPLL